MKSKLESDIHGFATLSEAELYAIRGGNIVGCDPSNCMISYAAYVVMELIKDNIEHPIGAAGGYPPK